MKKINAKKKIFSAIAVLALSATAVGGAVSFSACGSKYVSDGKASEYTVEDNKTVINTATGIVRSETSGNKYYVASNGGSLAEADGSKENPYDFYAILSDQNKLQPGDIVYVMPGTYSYQNMLAVFASGAYNNYIQILNAAYSDPDYSAAEGESKEVILDFYGQAFNSTARGVQIYGNYIYWYGIDICGAGDNGMYIGGSYNTIEFSEFYNNRDTGLQLGRSYSDSTDPKWNHIENWPSYNLIKNCTSHNNYDNETYGENADGFASKLTVGYGNVFDGCIAYRNSDDGWDLYAKTDSGNIGTVMIYNCVAYENGFLEITQREYNKLFPKWDGSKTEAVNPDGTKNTEGENFYGLNQYDTRDGDGNGFKLGGSVMVGDVIMNNCLSFNNKLHGVTDNSNPGVISLKNVTSYNNGAAINASTGLVNSVPVSSQNIDCARQSYSYNNFENILSVMDNLASKEGTDAYRGAVNNCVFATYTIVGSMDANTGNGTKSSTRVAGTTFFEQLPYTSASQTAEQRNITGVKDMGTFNEDGSLNLNPNRAHFKFRNSDGSINMGNLLKIKDSYNPIPGVTIGARLSETSYEDYDHYYESDFVNKDAETEAEAKVERAADALNVNCDPNSVYQDFTVPSKMIDCDLTWTTDDKEVLVIGEDKDISISQSEYITIYVYRHATEVKTVHLTATITYSENDQVIASTQKEFTLKVQPGDPSLGTLFVTAEDGTVIKGGGSYVVDRFSLFTEPVLNVENGLDYNGKLLIPGKQYTVKTTYEFQTDASGAKVQIADFSPSTPGVYTVTHKVTLTEGKNAGATASMSYKIFTASPTANVQFVSGRSVAINAEGFKVSGTLSSATGYLYAYSTTDLTESVTKENIKTLGDALAFRGENISLQFENDNNAQYKIFYALANANGDLTSDVYSQNISVVNVSTTTQFKTLAGGGTISGESPATTIYMLTQDLDFAGSTYSVSNKAFTGLLNGQGHTVKNASGSLAVFYKLSGGTIMNIKFDNISMKTSSGTKVGIISEMTGGYVHNVQILNSTFQGANIVGALIGKSSESAYAHYISNVYIDENTTVNGGSQRAGGIIGHIQSNSTPIANYICYISDCYVRATINAEKIAGGIVGEYDPNKIVSLNVDGNYYAYLEITSCVFDGEVYAPSIYLGGICGNQKGTCYLVVTDCISIGKLYYDADGAKSELTVCQKNASGIMGASTYSSTAVVTVENCIATLTEYADGIFEVLIPDFWYLPSIYSSRLDSESWSLVYVEGSDNTVEPPYVSLNFLGDWN